jgi:hypothetical protein
MTEPVAVLDQAVQFLQRSLANPPSAESVVEALLQAEKTAQQTQMPSSYQQLLGDWRLGFVTGTRRTRQRAGVVLGAGRFLPAWVKIRLSYAAETIATGQNEVELSDRGRVENLVELGALQLCLTGPTLFRAKTQILAFDFTQMTVCIFGRKIYSSYIRNGQTRETRFYQSTLKEQAFFTYFLIRDNCIAARGRGGGLALWIRTTT